MKTVHPVQVLPLAALRPIRDPRPRTSCRSTSVLPAPVYTGKHRLLIPRVAAIASAAIPATPRRAGLRSPCPRAATAQPTRRRRLCRKNKKFPPLPQRSRRLSLTGRGAGQM